MKPEDLFIGALVNYLHTEDGIAPYKEVIRISAEDICRDEYIIEAHYDPIPTTSEILEKNGWRYNDVPFIQGWEQYGLTIVNNRITCGQNISIKVEFIHQLQAALRLCGIEKEIVL